MAIIAPFRGLFYNSAKVPNLTEVVTPPYDVIRPAERQAFADRHPNNMVHLILPQADPGDDRLNNRYTRAGALFRQWEKDDVLVRDEAPAFYYWETEFQHAGHTYTRGALAALVRLEPLSGGSIKPHEQTFSAAKADRLELFKASQANFSPIFSIYPDPADRVASLLKGARPDTPLMDFKDTMGYVQRLYRITEAEAVKGVHRAFLEMPLFIADGHHRYETSLNFQKLMKQRYPQASPEAPFNYTLMYLSNMFDPDLLILMAHRLLGGPRLKNLEESWVMGRLKEYFEIVSLPAAHEFGEGYEDFLQQTLAEVPAGESAYVVLGFGRKAWRLILRPGVRQTVLARQMHPALAQLDVAVLNYLIFEKVMGLDAQAQDDQETCKYTSKISEVVAAVNQGEARLAFLLNPTRIEQVQEVATAGLTMPRKSTYFYPKVMTGMILSPINPQEEIVIPA
ncbi:MAG: DUF1015 domain-containing protein [Deltaproteobacteria bacterium]|nr:DUF1015 domain-containing protein [Deltaproteobacteria bacterium]